MRTGGSTHLQTRFLIWCSGAGVGRKGRVWLNNTEASDDSKSEPDLG